MSNSDPKGQPSQSMRFGLLGGDETGRQKAKSVLICPGLDPVGMDPAEPDAAQPTFI